MSNELCNDRETKINALLKKESGMEAKIEALEEELWGIKYDLEEVKKELEIELSK